MTHMEFSPSQSYFVRETYETYLICLPNSRQFKACRVGVGKRLVPMFQEKAMKIEMLRWDDVLCEPTEPAR